MKKTTLTLAIATALFTSITLFNCSKKEDPAPATTTTSGTTSGTTTSGTTTSGTTTSGTTTSGTTTSGTTTSGTTTSATTTSGTTTGTAGTTTGGSGTFQVDGIDNIPTKMTNSFIAKGYPFSLYFENINYTINISVGNVEYGDGKIATVAIAVIDTKFSTIYQSRGDTVVYSNKILKFTNIKVPRQYGDGKETLTISGNLTFE